MFAQRRHGLSILFRLVACQHDAATTRVLLLGPVLSKRYYSSPGYDPSASGIVTLYNGLPDETPPSKPVRTPNLDVIAVHGLGSNSAGAWTHPSTSQNWLQDFLPLALPHARIMAFNHESKWQRFASVQSLTDYGESLLNATRLVRRTDGERARPVILIGHSFGGTIIKKALNLASGRVHDPDPYYRSIYSAARGVLFLGTPHQGSNYALAGRLSARMTTLLGSRTELLEWIKPDSQALSELNDVFLRSFAHCDIFCFFEAQAPKNSLGLPQPLVVDKASAIIPGKPHGVLNLNHMQLNKFATPDDQDYQTVCEIICQMAADKQKAGSDTRGGVRGSLQESQYHLRSSPIMSSVALGPDMEEYLGPVSADFLNQMQPGGEVATRAKQQLEQLQMQDDFLEVLQPKLPGFYEDDIPTRHEGTCDWIFAHPSYQHWDDANDPSGKLLIVVAPPGWGKSVLAKHVLREHIEKTSSGGNELVMSFFCKNTEGRNNASAIVRSFLYALLKHRRALFRHISPAAYRSSLTENTLSFRALWAMLIAVLNESELGIVRLFIDGLDELLPESQVELLTAIEETLAQDKTDTLKSRIFITSRPTPIATEVGSRQGLLQVSLEDVATDISLFVSSEVGKLAAGRGYPEDISGRIQATLENDADGMFLWVRLVLEELNRDDRPDTRKAIDQVLESLPRNLGAFYALNVTNIPPRSKQNANRIFQLLLAAPDTLSQDQLGVLFAQWPEDCTSLAQLTPNIPLNVGRYAKSACGSMVKVTDAGITFVHQSARDYIQSQISADPIDEVLHIDLRAAQNYMLQTCLRYLHLEEIIAASQEKGTEDAQGTDFGVKYPFALYALFFWGYHAKAIDVLDKQSKFLLRQLFTKESPILETWVRTEYIRAGEGLTLPDTIDSSKCLLGALLIRGLGEIVRQIPLRGPGENQVTSPSEPLTDYEIDVNELDALGLTPLSIAVAYDNFDDANYLMEVGADPKKPGENGSTPLHFAFGEKTTSMLIDAGAEVDVLDKSDQTPLHSAAIYGKADTAKVLLTRGAKPDVERPDGATPLMLAVVNGQVAVAQELLKAEVNVRHTAKEGMTMICAAAKSNVKEMVDMLLERGVGIEEPDSDGKTPISYSVAGSNQTLEHLIKLGANVNHPSSTGETALQYAALYGAEGSVELLLENGADPEARESKGYSAIHFAAARANLQGVQLLFEKMKNPFHASKSGKPALFAAILSGSTELVEWMLKAGFSALEKDRDGSNALHYATNLASVDITQKLIEAGGMPTLKNKFDETPLILALQSNKAETARCLIDYGADPSQSCNGIAPIHMALQQASLDSFRMLIEKGVDVDAKLPSGHTCLHLAADEGNLEAINLLLEKGADVHAVDQLGHLPLHYAAWSGRDEVVRRLLKAGSTVDQLSHDSYTPMSMATLGACMSTFKILLEAGAEVDVGKVRDSTARDMANSAVRNSLKEYIGPPIATPQDASEEFTPTAFEATYLNNGLNQKYLGQERTAKIARAIEDTVKEFQWPEDLETREKFFMDEVGASEKLFMISSMTDEKGMLQAALHLYNAFRVYPDASAADLITIYRRTVPKPILAHVFEMLRADPNVNSRYWQHTPFPVFLSGEIAGLIRDFQPE